MYVKSVERKKDNLYEIKIQLEEADKYNFNRYRLKMDLFKILGIPYRDYTDENPGIETNILLFLVSSPTLIRYANVFNALNTIRSKNKKIIP